MRRAPGSAPRRRWLVGAGLLFGAAASIKQSVILHPGALVVWLAVDSHRRKAGRRAAIDVLALIFSTLLLPAAFVLHALARARCVSSSTTPSRTTAKSI